MESVNTPFTPLLSKSAAEMMGIIMVNYDVIEQVKVTRQVDLVKEFSDMFSSSRGGVLAGDEVHLLVEERLQPVIRLSRTVPGSLKSLVKEELDSLQHWEQLKWCRSPDVNQMSVAQKKSAK